MRRDEKNFTIGAHDVAILRDALYRCEFKPEDRRAAEKLRENLRGCVFANVTVMIQKKG